VKIRSISIIISIILVAIIGCGETINSTWKSQDIVIDGHANDWEGIPLQYQEDMKVVYGIINDETVINAMIRFNDERLARMFSMRGFTLWFNENNDEEEQIGIHYRDDAMRDQFRSLSRKNNRNSQYEDQQSPRLQKPKGDFTLANNESLFIMPLTDQPGFNAAADENEGIFCFEFSIPLTPESGSPHHLKTSDLQQIKVGLEIAGMSEEEKENLKAEMEDRRGSMQGSGKGGRGMGGMRGGGRRGGGGGNRPQMPDMDGEEYWISVKLATQ
jgi:uncharacterized membrane protein YgcG